MSDMNSTLHDHLKRLDGQLSERFADYDAKLRNIDADLLDVQQKGASIKPQARNGSNLPQVLSKSQALADFKSGASRGTGPIDLGLSIKALTSLQGSTSSPQEGIDVQSQREIGLYGHAMRPLTLLEALPVRAIGSNALSFTRMTDFSNAADTQEGEATSKAEQSITPELVTAPIETIAVWHDASRQVLDDEPGLAQTLSMLLQHGVQAKAESQIIAGAGGNNFTISGFTNEGTTFVPTVAPKADRIGESAATMQASGYQPDLVILHPNDWFAIRSERAVSGNEQYVGPGWASAAEPTVYGMPVVVSPAVTAGTAIVVDRRLVAVLDRMDARVEMSTESGNNFKANIATILAEMRVGLAVFDPKAVNVIDLSTSI
ncbi:phage major capsid protein [Alloalcanivorax venustensis]|uniref:phage major capsid protein n=1 Tax=Alloalcanivorax venustensis TaxID=172371 RepID=UPI003518BAEF